MATPPGLPPQPPPDLRPLDQVMAEFTDGYRAFLQEAARVVALAEAPRHRRHLADAAQMLTELAATKDAQLERLDQLRRWWAFLQDEAVVTLRAARGQDHLQALDDLLASKTDQQRLLARQLELVGENASLRADLARAQRVADDLVVADTRAIRSLIGLLSLPAVLLLALWLAR